MYLLLVLEVRFVLMVHRLILQERRMLLMVEHFQFAI
jgi:hypothetical protein